MTTINESIAALESLVRVANTLKEPASVAMIPPPLCDALATLLASHERMVEALKECQEWLADRADISDGPGACDPPRPNAAMSMQMMCDEILAALDQPVKES
jgi:hypothetical protein